jgi:hypothetical protein
MMREAPRAIYDDEAIGRVSDRDNNNAGLIFSPQFAARGAQ